MFGSVYLVLVIGSIHVCEWLCAHWLGAGRVVSIRNMNKNAVFAYP